MSSGGLPPREVMRWASISSSVISLQQTCEGSERGAEVNGYGPAIVLLDCALNGGVDRSRDFVTGCVWHAKVENRSIPRQRVATADRSHIVPVITPCHLFRLLRSSKDSLGEQVALADYDEPDAVLVQDLSAKL